MLAACGRRSCKSDAQREVFGHQDFSEGQLEAIQAALEGQDVVVRMTTSTGKSLCYQLPPYYGAGLLAV